MGSLKRHLFKLISGILFFFSWGIFFPIYSIAQKTDSSISSIAFHGLLIVFVILCILISVFQLLLYTPLRKYFFTPFRNLLHYLRGVGKYNLLLGIGVLGILTTVFSLLISKFIVLKSWLLIYFLFWVFGLILATISLSLSLRRIQTFTRIFNRKVLWILLGAFFIFILCYLNISNQAKYFSDFLPRSVLLVGTIFIVYECLSISFTTKRNLTLLLVSILFPLTALIIAANFLYVNNYPFTLTWSEGKSFLDASLLFSQKVYGSSSPIPLQQPTKALLLSILYFFSRYPSLLAFRAWQFLLTCLFPFLTALLVTEKRLHLKNWEKWFCILAIFVLLMIGPIKYYLFPILIVFFLGFEPQKFLQSTITIGISSLLIPPLDINWFPMVAALCLFIYTLETEYRGNFWEYIWKPMVWVLISLLLPFLHLYLFYAYSGNPHGLFSFLSSEALLWYRLFPSSVNTLGIFPSLLICISPFICLIYFYLNGNLTKIHWLRLFILFGLMGVFLVGGIVSSVKIGGGNNLHNMDGFLILLIILCSYLYFHRFQNLQHITPPKPFRLEVNSIFLLVIPAIFIILALPPRPDFKIGSDATNEVAKMQQMIDEYEQSSAKPGLMFFQSQLMATGQIKNITPIPNLDNVFLIEMAISQKSEFLSSFYSDLKAHRWSVIISLPLYESYDLSYHPFQEEQDAWQTKIANIILCYYRPAYESLDFNYGVYIPRESSRICPGN